MAHALGVRRAMPFDGFMLAKVASLKGSACSNCPIKYNYRQPKFPEQ